MARKLKDDFEADPPPQRQAPPVLYFGYYRLDQKNAQLWRKNRAVRLTPKAFQLLYYLVSRPGQLVSKDELFQAVWSETVVNRNTLRWCMKELRKALEDDAKTPRYIETVHRRGYRWIAETRGAGRQASLLSSPVFSFQSGASNIVGREAELTQLHGWLERARAGERQIVFVTGEPGIGKTTVVETFLNQIEEPVWIGRGQCIEHYGAGEAYMPVLEAFGRLCREAEDKRLIALLRQYAPTWLLQMPALLSLEDLHWSDYSTLGLVHK
jgi:DNA-binding winged helix-turn-helix (wHTH) protein